MPPDQTFVIVGASLAGWSGAKVAASARQRGLDRWVKFRGARPMTVAQPAGPDGRSRGT